MPKSRGRRRPNIPASQTRVPPLPPASPASTQMTLGYDATGPQEQRNVVGLKEGWSEYTLDDGSVIRAKAALVDVKRAVGQFNILNDDPIYVVTLTVVNTVIAPDHLKKQRATNR
jgi:hypothetical protein